MADTVNYTMRLDKEIKEEAESLFKDLGMSLSTAFNVFLRQTLRTKGLPFEVKIVPQFNWDNPNIVRIDPEYNHAVLPVEWDDDEDGIYDDLL